MKLDIPKRNLLSKYSLIEIVSSISKDFVDKRLGIMLSRLFALFTLSIANRYSVDNHVPVT